MMKTLLVGVLLLVGSSASVAGRPAADPPGVTLAEGKLKHFRLSNELFRVDELWIRVAEDTEFHRWLSQGIDRQVTVVLTKGTRRLDDEKGTRIQTGKLLHQTAPAPTSNTVDTWGELPPGNLPYVHIVFLQDETTGSLGALTLQTADRETGHRLDGFDDAIVTIVIRIE